MKGMIVARYEAGGCNCAICGKPIVVGQTVVLSLTDEVVLHKACLEARAKARREAKR
jgi:hypothetical protein